MSKVFFALETLSSDSNYRNSSFFWSIKHQSRDSTNVHLRPLIKITAIVSADIIAAVTPESSSSFNSFQTRLWGKFSQVLICPWLINAPTNSCIFFRACSRSFYALVCALICDTYFEIISLFLKVLNIIWEKLLSKIKIHQHLVNRENKNLTSWSLAFNFWPRKKLLSPFIK